MTDAPTKRLPVQQPSPDRSSMLQHVTVDNEDDVAVCTMFPQNDADADVTTEWITAGGESFVSLDDAR